MSPYDLHAEYQKEAWVLRERIQELLDANHNLQIRIAELEDRIGKGLPDSKRRYFEQFKL